MSQAKVELLKYTNDKEKVTYVYDLIHSNITTSLQQSLKIEQVIGSDQWRANITLTDFPEQPSQSEAALKMADWLERLAKTIKAGVFTDFPDTSGYFDVE